MQNDMNMQDNSTMQDMEMEAEVLQNGAGAEANDETNEVKKTDVDVETGDLSEADILSETGDGQAAEAVAEAEEAEKTVEEVAAEEESAEDAEEVVETEGTPGVGNTPVVQNADIPHERRVIRKRNTPSRVYAGFFVRLTAYLLDKIIIGVPLVIVRLILWSLQDMDSANILVRKVFFSFTVTDIILYLISIVYFVAMTYLMGRTIGKRIMKLKVVSAEDRKPTLFEIAFREIIGRYLSTVILWIGYLMIGAGDQKEALHDYLADTRVIYALD